MSTVSVIVPFFNASKTIKSTLDSIYKQTYNQFECILVDDDSSDESNLIAQQYVSKDKRFKLFKQSKKGVVSARNLGIKKSIGRYIAFLDADDIWDPNFLQESLNIRIKNKKPIAITHSSYFKFKVINKKIYSFFINPPLKIDYKNILKKNHMPLLTVLIDRKIIKELYFENKRPEDYRLCINLIYINKFESISINEPLAYYRLSENQRSRNKIKNLFRIYKFFRDIPNNNFFKQNLYTFNWIIYNSIQRIPSKKNINKKKLIFLESLIFNY